MKARNIPVCDQGERRGEAAEGIESDERERWQPESQAVAVRGGRKGPPRIGERAGLGSPGMAS